MRHLDSVIQHAHSSQASTADIKDGIIAEEQQFELQRLEKFLVPNLPQLKLLLQQTEEQLSHAKSLVDKLPFSKMRDERRRQIRLEMDDGNSLLERAGNTPGVSSQVFDFHLILHCLFLLDDESIVCLLVIRHRINDLVISPPTSAMRCDASIISTPLWTYQVSNRAHSGNKKLCVMQQLVAFFVASCPLPTLIDTGVCMN